MNCSDEEKEFIYRIFGLFGKKENIDSSFVGNGHTGNVWRLTDNLCLKVGTDMQNATIPECFKKCESLCVPLSTYYSESGRYVGVVQKYLNLHSIQYWIKNDIILTEKQASSVLHDILNGLNVIHENGYVHRDFYPGNIMLTKENQKVKAVIIDFDEMRPINSETKACFQYNGYQAPEIVFDNDTYDNKSEMFTVGVILWELVQGKCSFGGYDYFGKVIENSWDSYSQNKEFYDNRVKAALKTLPDFLEKTDGLSDECMSLLRSLLSFNRDERITAKEALEHPFFERFIGKEDYISNKKNKFA